MQGKVCGKKRHTKTEIRSEISELICGRIAAGENYNLTRDIYRQNILEYISYLKNIRQTDYKTGEKHSLSGKTINLKLVAVAKYNRIMQPEDIVIKKTDYIKIHENLVNPTDITKEEINIFRQKLLLLRPSQLDLQST